MKSGNKSPTAFKDAAKNSVSVKIIAWNAYKKTKQRGQSSYFPSEQKRVQYNIITGEKQG